MSINNLRSVIVYDGIYTKYEDAKLIITHSNAQEIIKMIEDEIAHGNITAQNYAILSKACIYANDFKNSLKYAKLSIKQDSTYAYGHARVAYAYARLKKEKQTLKYAQITEDLSSENFYILDVLNLAFKNLELEDENKRIIDKIISQKFNDPYFYKSKGTSYHILEDYKSALKYYKKAIKRMENNAALYGFIADSYFATKNYNKALTYFLKAKEHGQNTCFVNQRVSYIYIFIKNDGKKGLKYADDALLSGKEKAYSNYLKGWALGKLKNHDEALKYLLKAEKYGCAFCELYSAISRIYSTKDNYELSIIYADKALMVDEKYYYANYIKGFALYELKCYDEAREFLLNSEKYGCKYCDIFTKLSYIYSKNGDEETSLKYANKALLINKNDDFANYRKGRSLYLLNRYEESLKYLLKAEELGYKYYDLFSKAAYIYGNKEDYNKALKYSNKALLMNNKDGYTNCLKGFALYNLGKKQEAIKYLFKAKELGFKDDALDELIWALKDTPIK